MTGQKAKPCIYTEIDCKKFTNCDDCEKFHADLAKVGAKIVEYHKGEPCIYHKGVLCQKGFCSECTLAHTCVSCGLFDLEHVQLVDYQGESYPFCDLTVDCINRGAKLIVEKNKEKAVK
jgi:hypothetical protein